MLKSAIVRYTIYSASLIVLSEVAYQSFRALKNCYNNWYKNHAQQGASWAVILTNELTMSCPLNHRLNPNSRSAIATLQKISIHEMKPMCSNPYCYESNVGLIEDLLNAAKYSIDVAMFMITSVQISKALARASLRGVTVRIITDTTNAFSPHSQVLYLLKFDNVSIRFNPKEDRKLFHHKFCILDSPSTIKYFLKRLNKLIAKKLEELENISSALMTGSMNFTIQGFTTNFENVLLTDQKEMIQQYSDEYQRLWELFAGSHKD
uniref:Mitochondrial cardiolipin hydrolase n=1 Tax=Glossina brevipalpis TaxID=37001 RepID=A0A1A9W262_9MUSC